MTDTVENDGLGPCPTPGEIRVFDGQRCRFIERELEGDKWVVLGPAPMTDTVRVPRAWLEAFRRDTDPTEPIADNGGTVWDMFCHEASAMLAASPQGEGSSADWITHDGGPNPVPGKIVEVRFKDGRTGEPLDSECYGWTRHPDPDIAPAYDIIAYRVTEGVKRSKPDALPDDLRERVAAILKDEVLTDGGIIMSTEPSGQRRIRIAGRILDLIQSERAG